VFNQAITFVRQLHANALPPAMVGKAYAQLLTMKDPDQNVVVASPREEVFEIMSLRDGLPQFLEKRLQVLLRRLLAMEGDQVVKRLVGAGESAGSLKIGLGFSHPFARCSFHTGPCLESRSLCETTRPPSAAIRGSPECARSSP
jgi:hypothetical protein